MKKLKVLILLVSCINIYSYVHAQDSTANKTAEELFDLSLDDLLNVVITPSKLPQHEGSYTQKVDLIKSEQIESIVQGNRNICELISKLPGTSVSVLSRNDANWGTYGGIGPKYSTYMLQGLPVDAFVDPMSLDNNIIEQIEVQRGPASVIYPNYLSQDFAGSQSPLSGTVNLVLKDKINEQKTVLHSSYGSYNTLNEQVYHQNKKDRLNYFLGSSYEMSDYTDYGIENSWLNMKKSPEYKKTKLYGGITLFTDKSEKQKLTVFCNNTWHSGDVGRVYRQFDHQYSTLNVGYEILLSEKLHFQTHAGIRSYKRMQQESNYGATDTLNSNTGVNQFIVPVDISIAWMQGTTGSLSLGADYQGADYETWSDPLKGHQIYGNKSSAFQTGMYIQEEWRPIEKLTLRGGLRYAYIENTIDLVNGNNPIDNRLSWKKLIWSAGTRYSISKSLAVYVNGGSSFSAPGLKSIGGTIQLSDLGVQGRNGQLPNPDIKPENGLGIDIGTDCKLQNTFKINVRGFYYMLKDGIIDNIVSLNPSQTQSINTKSNCKGGEIELSQLVNSSISWYANFTYLQTNIENDLNKDLDQVEIPFSPNYIGNIGATIMLPFGLSFSPAVNYNGGYYDAISKPDRQWYKPGTVVNTYISQRLAQSDFYTLDCTLQLYNITNNKYKMPWQFQNTGFSGMVGVKVTFK